MMTRIAMFACLFCLAMLSPAYADFINYSGQICVIAPPASVVVGALESNTCLNFFQERLTVTRGAPITVDITATGTYPPNVVGTFVLPAGTLVDSFYLHNDHVGTTGAVTLNGSVMFDTDVIGIASSDARLSASDGQLGAAGTVYTPSSRAYEFDTCPGGDKITLSADRRTVTACATTGPVADDLRIITKGRVPIVIDIKPGSFPNSINTRNRGVIPVAILGGFGLDVTLVDVSTLVFAGGSPSHTALDDVNGDGVLDLIMQFPTQSTNLTSVDTQACVKGNLLNSTPFKGCDSVNIVW